MSRLQSTLVSHTAHPRSQSHTSALQSDPEDVASLCAILIARVVKHDPADHSKDSRSKKLEKAAARAHEEPTSSDMDCSRWFGPVPSSESSGSKIL